MDSLSDIRGFFGNFAAEKQIEWATSLYIFQFCLTPEYLAARFENVWRLDRLVAAEGSEKDREGIEEDPAGAADAAMILSENVTDRVRDIVQAERRLSSSTAWHFI